jgi:hypothetical protein
MYSTQIIQINSAQPQSGVQISTKDWNKIKEILEKFPQVEDTQTALIK